jgi:hypothetical protein
VNQNAARHRYQRTRPPGSGRDEIRGGCLLARCVSGTPRMRGMPLERNWQGPS